MAIKSKVLAQSLVIKLNLGEDKKGKISYKNLTLKGLKPDALNEAIYSVAAALKTVLPYDMDSVSKSTETEIIDDSIEG